MKGILFTPDNIKAIRDGRKTQTRRLIKKLENPDDWWLVASFDDNTIFRFGNDKLDDDRMIRHPYRVGEIAYIKEAWTIEPDDRSKQPTISENEIVKVKYIDGEMEKRWGDIIVNDNDVWLSSVAKAYITGKWQSPMFLSHKSARTFIKINDVRPERLHDITEEDAKAEGCLPSITMPGGRYTAIYAFQILWDSIYGGTYPFAFNPWAWNIEFELATDARNPG